jgi:hypothetical protein
MPLWETPDGMPPGHVLPLHPGDWRMHHLAILRSGGGRWDLSPVRVSHDIEVQITVLGQFMEYLREALGIDREGPIGSRSLPAVSPRGPSLEAG